MAILTFVYAIMQQSEAYDARDRAEASMRQSKEKLAQFENEKAACNSIREQLQKDLYQCMNQTTKK